MEKKDRVPEIIRRRLEAHTDHLRGELRAVFDDPPVGPGEPLTWNLLSSQTRSSSATSSRCAAIALAFARILRAVSSETSGRTVRRQLHVPSLPAGTLMLKVLGKSGLAEVRS